MNDTPPGFRLLRKMDEVLGAFDPVYVRREDDGHLVFGFRVGPQHCNPSGNCHGGTWATVADVALGINVAFLTSKSGPTVSMTLDFVGPAAKGQWVEGRARVLRWTPNLAFVEGHFTADGELVLRANAIFRRRSAYDRSFEDLLAEQGKDND